MSDWIKAINPKAPIANEAEALQAARASALAIIIGVVVGIIGLVWTVMNPQDTAAALAAAEAQSPEAAGMAQTVAQGTLWLAGAMVAIQAIFAFVQWRDPKKFIAILFIALIAFGFVTTLAAPMMASAMPDAPVVPMWQIVLSLVILAIQAVMHVAGLRGMSRLNQFQFDAAR